jgi:hypothetical protein
VNLTAPPTRVKYKGVRGVPPLRERPIMFGPAMVRAILAGTKTQTRRPVKLHADGTSYDRCRYGAPGELLWVRETWTNLARPGYQRVPVYRADGTSTDTLPEGVRWKPSLLMPRWASRLDLEVTGVRVERLQDISEADALAEGLVRWTGPSGGALYGINQGTVWDLDVRLAYLRLWDSINGKRAPWASNPWVWVIAFRRLP